MIQSLQYRRETELPGVVKSQGITTSACSLVVSEAQSPNYGISHDQTLGRLSVKTVSYSNTTPSVIKVSYGRGMEDGL